MFIAKQVYPIQLRDHEGFAYMSDSMTQSFREFFRKATAGGVPYPYQERFATEAELPELLRAPTGSGKTATAVLGWLWRRLYSDRSVPRRLVYCLPMRTLVEQCHAVTKSWLDNLDLSSTIGLHVLMGGVSSESWFLRPEAPAILFGTQDMLLSRALNRGYGASRFHWPIDFGLLNNDCLWVFDEPQLMGAGVTTSAQLAGLRSSISACGENASLWMSATLEPNWLATVDFPQASQLTSLELHSDDYRESADNPLHRRMFASKRLARLDLSSSSAPREIAKAIRGLHQAGSQTLVVVNTVKRARQLYQELEKTRAGATDLLLLHSRFRPAERKMLQAELAAAEKQTRDRIIVATQVVEAGLDLSARTLVTELAPWSSLVQRMGRCNRTGEEGQAGVFWIDVDEARDAAPYSPSDLEFARELLLRLDGQDLSPKFLEDFKRAAGFTLPFERRNVLRRRDLLDLYDTTADLSGADLDVQRFVRGDQADLDVLVYWRDLADLPDEDESAPRRDELCPVPKGEFAEFLKLKGGRGKLAFCFDHLDREWRSVEPQQLRPGQAILLVSTAGGYSTVGWDANSDAPVRPVPIDVSGGNSTPDEDYGGEPNSQAFWRAFTIAEHTDGVCRVLDEILGRVSLDDEMRQALRAAARWHDVGKAHDVFQETIHRANSSLARDQDWAKSGSNSALRHKRKYFRHELASALAARQSNLPFLTVYLIAAHHGRIRVSIRALPDEVQGDHEGAVACGVAHGDRLHEVSLGNGVRSAAVELNLSPMFLGGNPSWTDSVLELLDRFGPFRLAYLESLLRSADSRASAAERTQGEVRHV